MRLRSNPNLSLHQGGNWKYLPVIDHRGMLIDDYLESIHTTLTNAITEYPRTCVIRFDLHMPESLQGIDSAVISRFTRSLKSQLRYDLERKEREGRRVHPCRMRFVWARERQSAGNCHYHVAILLNRDAYFTLGNFRNGADTTALPYESGALMLRKNMADRIRQALASALGLDPHLTSGLVHFPQNPVHDLDVNARGYDQQFSEAFYRLSYLAKVASKHYGDYENSFGCSRG